MNDTTAQDPQVPQNTTPVSSYLDDYLPPLPTTPQASSSSTPPSVDDIFALPEDTYAPPQPLGEPAASYTPPAFTSAPAPASQPMAPVSDFAQSLSSTPVMRPTSTASAAPAPTTPIATADDSDSADTAQVAGAAGESLEDQNIFDLLGVTDGTDEEKERFLDELQQVIWEDFLENDVKLLLTTQELSELDVLVKAEGGNDLEKQEKIVVFLEKLIPDLEEIMLEKALELKGDLVKERVAGMREFFAQNQQALQTLEQAEQKMNDGQWKSAAQLLNGLKQ